MKPTQRQIEREALRLLSVYVGRPLAKISNPENFEGWIDGCFGKLARHVLRRIAAAERRGAMSAFKEFNALERPVTKAEIAKAKRWLERFKKGKR